MLLPIALEEAKQRLEEMEPHVLSVEVDGDQWVIQNNSGNIVARMSDCKESTKKLADFFVDSMYAAEEALRHIQLLHRTINVQTGSINSLREQIAVKSDKRAQREVETLRFRLNKVLQENEKISGDLAFYRSHFRGERRS